MANFKSNFRPFERYFAIAIALFALLVSYNGFGAENVAQGVKVIVIDAGHGGSRFPGAGYNGFAEKDINLQVALKLGALIEKNLPNIKVVQTRTVDKYFSTVLSEDLQARADIAHRNEGDLFISIHSNAHRNSEVRGVETLIMGETSMEQRVNQNALYLNNKEELLDMSDQKTATIVRAYIQNLQFTYGEYSEMMARLIQEEYVKLGYNNRGVRRQPLKVLYATDMPSVLTEIGFMSNPADLKHITSEKGQKEIAGAIFRAVKQYVENVRRSLLLDSGAQTTPAPQPQKEIKEPAKPTPTTPKAQPMVKRYAIQLMASVKKIPTNHPELKSYRGKVWILEGNSALKYKYCYGSFADKAVAQQHIAEVRKEFPQAFIISYEK
ncbi:MAG: N-acetylmuramoyl-L-alanine amidase [Alistipes sp.]|nr:N-acetylmuramoyl-L-alanine amidase [Alistipes sp.]